MDIIRVIIGILCFVFAEYFVKTDFLKMKGILLWAKMIQKSL